MIKLILIVMALVAGNPEQVPVGKLESGVTFQSKEVCQKAATEWLKENGEKIKEEVVKRSNGTATATEVKIVCYPSGGEEI